MAKKNSQYEAMFLLGPVAGSADDVTALPKQIVESHDGKIMVIKKWDERKLSYELAGQKRGTFVVVFFTAPGSAVTQIERDVNLSEEILRVIVLKADHLSKEEMEAVEPQKPAPVEEKPIWDRPWEDRPERSDRPQRGGDRGDRPRGRREEEGAALE
jgi:ribosomal protein S6